MAIDWKTTVAQLDADSDITTPAGMAVLSALVAAGHQYDTAGSPDVLRESQQHQQWASLRASQRIGVPEPSFYEAAYYARGRLVRTGLRDLLTIDQLPPGPRESAQYWSKRTEPEFKDAVQNILRYYTAKARDEELARRPQGPTNGAIQGALVSAMSAAQAFLAA